METKIPLVYFTSILVCSHSSISMNRINQLSANYILKDEQNTMAKQSHNILHNKVYFYFVTFYKYINEK